jgi:hypothetical protein
MPIFAFARLKSRVDFLAPGRRPDAPDLLKLAPVRIDEILGDDRVEVEMSHVVSAPYRAGL